MSAANWGEVLSKLAEKGFDPDTEAHRLADQGILHQALTICPVDEAAAREIARLRPLTRSAGLSLGDRECRALGRILGLPVLTTDRGWKGLNVGVVVELIR